ncbi:hypothetical protein Hanom_Chr16g01500281 [Helianthus anomalus]
MLFLEILYYYSRLLVVKSETWIINKIRISLNSPSTYSYMFIRSNSLYIESLFVIHTYTILIHDACLCLSLNC